MNAIAKPTVVLLSICIIISASLAFTYALTKDRIAASETEEANNARAAVFPGAEFEFIYKMDDGEISKLNEFPAVTELYTALTPDGAGKTAAGYVATVLTHGYGGEIEVIVGVRSDGYINGVRVSKHSETPGLGANAVNPEFYGQYEGKDATNALGVVKAGNSAAENDIVAISGATVTSGAVTSAVNAAARAMDTR